MTIDEIKQQLDKEISKFSNDTEGVTFYLITLGRRSPGLNASDKIEKNLVKGCQTKTWFNIVLKESRVYLSVDSNTMIIKGLGTLLARLLNGQTITDVCHADLDSITPKSLRNFVGHQHSEGLIAMIHHLRFILQEI